METRRRKVEATQRRRYRVQTQIQRQKDVGTETQTHNAGIYMQAERRIHTDATSRTQTQGCSYKNGDSETQVQKCRHRSADPNNTQKDTETLSHRRKDADVQTLTLMQKYTATETQMETDSFRGFVMKYTKISLFSKINCSQTFFTKPNAFRHYYRHISKCLSIQLASNRSKI